MSVCLIVYARPVSSGDMSNMDLCPSTLHLSFLLVSFHKSDAFYIDAGCEMIADVVHGPLLFSSSYSLGRPIRAHYFAIKALLAALRKITDLFAFPRCLGLNWR